MRLAPCIALLGCCLLSGCAGYQLGPTQSFDAGSRTIEVVPFQNDTLEPRLIQPVAHALRRHIQQDGTYRLQTRGAGDIVVTGVIRDYDRAGITFDPFDTRTPRDFNLTITARVTAVDRVTGRTVLDRDVLGRTVLRGGADLSSAERQGIPLAADDLARNITNLLADGEW